MAPGRRRSVARKREVVLRLLRGESVELLSRELGVPAFKLEQWRQKAEVAPMAKATSPASGQRQCWSGRVVNGPVGQDILVGALGTLAMHFGLAPRQRAA